MGTSKASEKGDEMTALEACNKIEEAISGLHPETRTEGWDWCYTKVQSDSAHLADHQETLEKTRAHFSLKGDTSMWFVGTHESNTILANCGNSPTAEARSRYISWVNPQNLSLIIARLRELEARSNPSYTWAGDGPEPICGCGQPITKCTQLHDDHFPPKVGRLGDGTICDEGLVRR